jgi:hypothetical protein
MEMMAEAKPAKFFPRKPSQQENAELSSTFCGKLTISIQRWSTTPRQGHYHRPG